MRRVLFLAVLTLATTASAIDQIPNNLVIPVSSSAQILIPAAGSVQGAEGTFFRSEINIINYGSSEANLQIRWIPRAGEGASVVVAQSLPAGTGFGFEDFVATFFQRSGLGSITITAVTSSGTVDIGARIYATCRIWTPQPGTNGTTSQTFNVVPMSVVAATRLAMVGLRRDSQYRLNVGIVNLDATNAQNYQITVGGRIPSEISTVTVPAFSMQQFSMVGAAHPATGLQVNVENVTPTGTRSNSWITYASSVDNVTGDSWSVLGFTPATP